MFNPSLKYPIHPPTIVEETLDVARKLDSEAKTKQIGTPQHSISLKSIWNYFQRAMEGGGASHITDTAVRKGQVREERWGHITNVGDRGGAISIHMALSSLI